VVCGDGGCESLSKSSDGDKDSSPSVFSGNATFSSLSLMDSEVGSAPSSLFAGPTISFSSSLGRDTISCSDFKGDGLAWDSCITIFSGGACFSGLR